MQENKGIDSETLEILSSRAVTNNNNKDLVLEPSK
jgi:hypothetical protein